MVPPLSLSPSPTRLPDLDFSRLQDVVRPSPDKDPLQAGPFRHRFQHRVPGRQRRSGRTANWLSHTGQRALGRSFLKAWGFDDRAGEQEAFDLDDVRVLPGRVVVSMPDGTSPLLHVPMCIIKSLAPQKDEPWEMRVQAARTFEEFCRRTVEGFLGRDSPLGQEDELGCWLIKKDKVAAQNKQTRERRRQAGGASSSTHRRGRKARSSASTTAKGATLCADSTVLCPSTSRSSRSASVSQSGVDAPSTPRCIPRSEGTSVRSATIRSAGWEANPPPAPQKVLVSEEAAAAISRYFATTVCASPSGYTSGSDATETGSFRPAGDSVPTVGQYSIDPTFEDDEPQPSVLQTYAVVPIAEDAVEEEDEDEGEDLLADGKMDAELEATLKELPCSPVARQEGLCEVSTPRSEIPTAPTIQWQDEYGPRSSSSGSLDRTIQHWSRHVDDPFLLATRFISPYDKHCRHKDDHIPDSDDVDFSPSGLPVTKGVRSPLLKIMGWANARGPADWERWREEVVPARAHDESAIAWGREGLRLDEERDGV